MEIYEPSTQMKGPREGSRRCLLKAIEKTHNLLAGDVFACDYDEIHSAKSILYAAIEQMGMKIERLSSVRRMLRELLLIVTSQYDSPGQDKETGLKILEEIRSYANDL